MPTPQSTELAQGYALAPLQGGTGLDASQAPANQILVTTGANAFQLVTIGGGGLIIPSWQLVGNALDFTQFQTAATLKTNLLFNLPAAGVIQGVIIKASAAFTGALITAVTAEVGIVGTTDKYAGAFDVLQAVGDTVFSITQVFSSENFAAATAINITLRSTGANLSALATGALSVWALTSVFN